ncbi:MAG: PAS domain S-box protein [Deltaproteobacteria bacterium]|nr:PAS domain S-box protein [Deltaproteobacteria bacterium]
MNRITQFLKGSIINKVILVVALILISVGGILAVNIISFLYVKDSLELIVDRDVGQVIENTRINNDFRNSIILGDLLLHTFIERQDTLEQEKDRLIDEIKADIRSLKADENTSKKIFQEYIDKLDKLFDRCAAINGILNEINTIEEAMDIDLAILDDIVIEKELTMAIEDSEETESIKQLAIMLPGYREIFSEIILEFIKAKNTHLGAKEIIHDHEQKIRSLLDEFDIGLNAMPIAWNEIIPYVRNLMELTSRYKFQIAKVFKSMREFHEDLGDLKLFQKQVIAETWTINYQIFKNTDAIRKKTSENISSSIKTTIFLSTLIILILIVIGGFTVRLVQPIKKLSVGADKIGAGDLNYQVNIDSNDEIGNLAESFNHMTDNLRKTTVSKEYVQNILKSMNEALIVSDPQGNIQTANQAACDLSGYTAEELVGAPIEKIFGDIESRNITRKNIGHKPEVEKSVQQRFIMNTQNTVLGKDGREIPVLFSASAILDKDQNIQGMVCVASDITDLKNAQSAVRDSEEKYRTLVEQSLQGIIVIQKNRIVYANSAFAAIVGYTIEELYSFSPEKVIALIHPDDQSLFWGRLKERLAGKKVTQKYEYRGISKDGSERSLEMYAGLIALNGLPAVQCTILDITERKQAEAALKVSEANYRHLFNAEPDAIIIVDAETKRIVDVNPAALKLYGYDYNEICGLQAVALSAEPQKSAQHIRQILAQDSLDGTREIVQRLHKIKDGTVFPVEIGHGFYTRDGRKMICAVMRDITIRKRMADELAAEKERLTVTLRSIGDGVISTDLDGKIILVNKVAEELTGWQEKEAMGKPLTKVFHIVDEFNRKRCEDPVRKVMETGGVVGLANNTILIGKDGKEHVIADSGAPIRDNQNKIIGAVLVFRDITEKRKMEAELVNAQKLESLGVLAGGIAHDFNNFLTAIIGNLSLAKLDSKPGDRVVVLLNEMEKASIQAKNLTQQLLTFSRGGEPVKKLIALAELVKNSATFSLRGSNVRCEFSISQDLLPTEVDEGQIGQVINNLVLNADQAMPEGGIIEICAENITLTADNEFSLPAGPYLRTSFRDHGVGIAPDHLPKVFDPYFTTKQKGSGLGLTVAYSIVDKHNGRMTVESGLGHGTTFTIYLPASDKPASQPADEEKRLFIGKGKILVMDDEEFIRDVATQMLSNIGYEVSVAIDGNQAIEMYRQAQKSGEPFDTVIMDLTIPGGMGGKEAIQKLKKLDPNVTALVSSGYSNDPIMSNFRDYGFQGVVKKPYRIQDMSDALRSVIKIKTE